MPQRLSDIPLAQLIPETQQWNDGRGIDLLGWIGCAGGIDHAIGYGEMFWPDFVEFEGCIFFAGFSEQSYRGFMIHSNGNRQAVEAVMNHWHILDLFSGSTHVPTREQVIYLGRLLREMWSAKLARDFPNRKFVVSFLEDDAEDLLDCQITFYQEEKPD